MLTAGTPCPSLAWPRASQKHETPLKSHFPPFYRAGSITRAIRQIAELGIKPSETSETASPPTAAPAQKPSRSLQLLSAFPSNAEQLLWETTDSMSSQGLARPEGTGDLRVTAQLWYDSYIFSSRFRKTASPKIALAGQRAKGTAPKRRRLPTSPAAPADARGGSSAPATAAPAPARSLAGHSAGDGASCGTANCAHTSVLAARATCHLYHLCNFHLPKLKASPRSLAGHQALG